MITIKFFVALVADQFEYSGPLQLTEYHVRNTEIRTLSQGTVRVQVRLQRTEYRVQSRVYRVKSKVQSTEHKVQSTE